jgi:hypothetical protein
MDGTPLQRHRRAQNMTQEQVADQLRNEVGPAHGYPNLGIDANAVSRHERGIIAIPRPPYPELYARLYRTTVAALWPGRMTGMERRQFLQAMAATPLAALLSGEDAGAEAITAVTGGFRRLESTTAAAELGAPVTAHLRFITGRLEHGGSQLAAAASEAAGLAAWLAVDQADGAAAGHHYRQAVGYARRSGSDTLAAYMLGSMALWAAETGQANDAARLVGQARQSIPQPAPPTVGAWLAAIEATAQASAGDADATLAACKRAETAVAAGHEPLWPWLFPFDHARLAGYVGPARPGCGCPGRPCRRSPRPWRGSARPGPSSAPWCWRIWPPTIAPSGTTTRPRSWPPKPAPSAPSAAAPRCSSESAWPREHRLQGRHDRPRRAAPTDRRAGHGCLA